MKNDLSEFGKVKENVDLKNYNTYKIPRLAKYLVDVKSEESLIGLIDYLNKKECL